MNHPKIPRKTIGNTLVDYPRLYKLIDLIEETKNLEGHIAEVGVYKGGTAVLLATYMNPLKRLYLFDTFLGLPDVKPGVDLHHKGDFRDTSIPHVESILPNEAKYAIYKGIFPRENAEYVNHYKFSLVHLDVDIYDSVMECLEYFVPKMVSGGVIILDDYKASTCPGAKLAGDEFCIKNPAYKIELTVQSQAIIRIP